MKDEREDKPRAETKNEPRTKRQDQEHQGKPAGESGRTSRMKQTRGGRSTERTGRGEPSRRGAKDRGPADVSPRRGETVESNPDQPKGTPQKEGGSVEDLARMDQDILRQQEGS